MTSLRRMGSGPTFLSGEFSWPTRSITTKLGRNLQEHSRDEDASDEAALLEGLRLAAQERAELRATILIQRFWRFSFAPKYHDDPYEYSPVCLGYTQSDLDGFTPECRSILHSANMMLHPISPTRELLLPEDGLIQIVNAFLDDSREPADCQTSFVDCVRYLFGSSQRVEFDESVVPGAMAAYWIRRYFVHRQVQAAGGADVVTREHMAIAMTSLMYAAAGKNIPEDIVV